MWLTKVQIVGCEYIRKDAGRKMIDKIRSLGPITLMVLREMFYVSDYLLQPRFDAYKMPIPFAIPSPI